MSSRRAAEAQRSMLLGSYVHNPFMDGFLEALQVLRLTMLNKDEAIKIRNHALKAIEELMALVYISKDKCSPAEHEQIERGVGLSIGKIQMEILEVINAGYPELDDLIHQQTKRES